MLVMPPSPATPRVPHALLWKPPLIRAGPLMESSVNPPGPTNAHRFHVFYKLSSLKKTQALR